MPNRYKNYANAPQCNIRAFSVFKNKLFTMPSSTTTIYLGAATLFGLLRTSWVQEHNILKKVKCNTYISITCFHFVGSHDFTVFITV